MAASERKLTQTVLPIYGMKTKCLSSEKLLEYHIKMQPVEVGYQLVSVYQHDLLRAALAAAGSEVVTISDQRDSQGKLRNYLFVRDPVVTLSDQKLMLYTDGNKEYGADDILNQGKEKGHEVLKVKDAYFEGGNVFYCPHKKVLLHGLNPVGRYEKPSYKSSYAVYPYTVDPVKTNLKLTELLAERGIVVSGLQLDPAVMNMRASHDLGSYGFVHRYNYYHLDCFMQLLPDGRVVILNKEILSKSSQDKMKEIFGDDFIDLAYSDYLTKPVLFNFIALQNGDKTYVISPSLPESVFNSLKNLNLNVITLNVLDSRSPNYDEEFSRRVAIELQNLGYKSATADSLATRIPKCEFGYQMDNGTKLPASIRDDALGAYCEDLDKYFGGFKEAFNYGSGGPHCLIADIMPCITMKPAQAALPKPSTTTYTRDRFFLAATDIQVFPATQSIDQEQMDFNFTG